MAYLLGNLKASLEQTKERLNLLNERGVEALNILYPGLNYGGMLYYQLLESLPKEITGESLNLREYILKSMKISDKCCYVNIF
ncbi:hypothetical protein ACQKGD_25495 [Peribacillus frigoritolerans]|uniref:hypothetical protein n=1 Tax=Peribacillus frigoritolerans TaxID=450367 RepID=UPI00207AF74E|nr:hypothetical protein [Peribacillus frigoritolerans]USK68131.1 hypothetical protein LIT26_30285 [Peribacillus frigoritolerans]